MSNRDDVKPQAMMRYMEEDESSVSALSHAVRRIKIDENWTWSLRLLPVQIGADKMPYVRMARHWRNKKPIYCPTWTPKSWGGDPDYRCPVCASSERLKDSSDTFVRDIGYGCYCRITRKFWGVVFDMQDPRGKIEQMPIEEVLNPYELEMTQNTWVDFKKAQKLAATRQRNPTEFGCLDLESGCNFLATGTTKGIRLDRDDPYQIFDGICELDDPNWNKFIEKIWAKIHKPVITLPTQRELDDFAAKVDEDAESGGGNRRGGRGRGGRDRDDDRGRAGRFSNDDRDRDRDRDRDDDYRRPGRAAGEDQDTEERPARRRREEPEAEAPAAAPRRRQAPAETSAEPEAEAATAPARRQAPEPEPEAEASTAPTRRRAPAPEPEREPEPEAEAPAIAAPPRRSSATRQQPEPEEAADVHEAAAAPIRGPAPTGKGAPTAPAAPAPARRQPAPAATENGDDGDLGPQAPVRRQNAPVATGAPTQAGVDEEEDNAPAEATDQAPPAKEKVTEAPPPVSTRAPAPKTGSNPEELQARLARLNKRNV